MGTDPRTADGGTSCSDGNLATANSVATMSEVDTTTCVGWQILLPGSKLAKNDGNIDITQPLVVKAGITADAKDVGKRALIVILARYTDGKGDEYWLNQDTSGQWQMWDETLNSLISISTNTLTTKTFPVEVFNGTLDSAFGNIALCTGYRIGAVLTGNCGMNVDVEMNPNTLENLALNKPATQHNVRGGGPATAVDGILTGGIGTHANNPWWQVDLGDNYEVISIIIHNPNIAGSAYVLLSDKPFPEEERHINALRSHATWYSGISNGDKKSFFVAGVKGQYVRVQGRNGKMYLSEVEVFGAKLKGSNVAMNKSARQSSTAQGGNADRAVDGNTSGNWSEDSVTHTNLETGYYPWWEVDLGDLHEIDTINLYNRTDCCSERLKNFRVYVSKYRLPDNSRTAATEQADWYANHVPVVGENVTIDVGAIGRYVRIQHNYSGEPMSLAEVEVMGRAIQLDRTVKSHSVAYNITYFIKNQHSTYLNKNLGYLRMRTPFDAGRYDIFTKACTYGNTHCAATGTNGVFGGVQNTKASTYWHLRAVSPEISGAVHCGDLVYLVNRADDGWYDDLITESYLDVRGTGCYGNRYCVSGTTEFNRAKGGTGIWKVQCTTDSLALRKQGLHKEQPFHLVNLYEPGGGYLDIRGEMYTYYLVLLDNNWVSTASSPTRDGGSGTWIVKETLQRYLDITE
ncbi:discoidin domain-containing protein [Candidatus Halobeggiatoa sp. HSG11]|nr:discoidin domain-containing protein [Candidatus Halobeggiatoa sp. HSG11]